MSFCIPFDAYPHSGWFALRLEAFLPADAKASPQKLPNCTSFTSSPFSGALYFFTYFSNESTNSFNTNWSLSLSSCNCSAIYFLLLSHSFLLYPHSTTCTKIFCFHIYISDFRVSQTNFSLSNTPQNLIRSIWAVY